jgi:benzoate-CoA ligase
MDYNAAADLIERNLAAGRGEKIAFIDDHGRYSYRDLAARAGRFANAMRARSVDREQRILLCLHDGIDFPTAFLGAIKAGIVPVAVNTMLSPEEFAFMLGDSRAQAIAVSAPVLPAIQQAVALLPDSRPARSPRC